MIHLLLFSCRHFIASMSITGNHNNRRRRRRRRHTVRIDEDV